jgi:hypothetical protein
MSADWPALLIAYQSALADFDRAAAAVTTALVDLSSDAEDFSALFAVEERAREAVILTRMRLMDAWRESQPEVQHIEALLAAVRDKHI